MLSHLKSGYKLYQGKIRGVWRSLGLRETDGMAEVRYSWMNEEKKGLFESIRAILELIFSG